MICVNYLLKLKRFEFTLLSPGTRMNNVYRVKFLDVCRCRDWLFVSVTPLASYRSFFATMNLTLPYIYFRHLAEVLDVKRLNGNG